MILVTGANGTVGSHVVAQLADEGHKVRAFVRDAHKGQSLKREGVEISLGEYENAASLDAAFDDVEGVFLISPTTRELVDNEQSVIDAAVRVGRPRIVKISAFNAKLDAPVEFLRMHAAVVERLRTSRVPYTVLEPNDYMQNFLRQAVSVQQHGKISASLGNATISHIDARDIAEVAVRALTTDGHDGATYELTGPEALSRTEVAARISHLLGREIFYEDVPLEDMRKTLLNDQLPTWLIEQIRQLVEDYRAGRASRVSNGVQEVLGRRPYSIDEFLIHHREAFESGVGGRWP